MASQWRPVDSPMPFMMQASRKFETAAMALQIFSCSSGVSLDLRPGGRGAGFAG
jgi:hypothetical protein